MTQRPSPLLVFAAMALGLSLLGKHCPGDDPPSYPACCVQTTRADGTPAGGACLPVPLQPGSVLEERVAIDGPVWLTLRVMRQEVAIDLEGTSSPQTVSFALEDGKGGGEIAITAIDGATYELTVSSW